MAPSLFFTFTSAPSLIKSFDIKVLPFLSEINKGVAPLFATAFTAASFSKSSCTMYVLPNPEAEISAVLPSLDLMFTSAPYLIKSFEISLFFLMKSIIIKLRHLYLLLYLHPHHYPITFLRSVHYS